MGLEDDIAKVGGSKAVHYQPWLAARDAPHFYVSTLFLGVL